MEINKQMEMDISLSESLKEETTAPETTVDFLSLLSRPPAVCKSSLSGKIWLTVRELNSTSSDLQRNLYSLYGLDKSGKLLERAALAALRQAAAAVEASLSLDELAAALRRPAARLSARCGWVDACLKHVTALLAQSDLTSSSRSASFSSAGSSSSSSSTMEIDEVTNDAGGNAALYLSERVLLAWAVHSFNEWGRADERVLVLTTRAVYRCREDTMSGHVSVSSRVPLEAVCTTRRGRGEVFAIVTKGQDTYANPYASRARALLKQASRAPVDAGTCERCYAAAVPTGVDAIAAGELIRASVAAAARLHNGLDLPAIQ